MNQPKAPPKEGTRTLATLIHDARLGKGYSRAELAERAGVTRAWIWQVEEGRKPISRHETVMRMAAALDLKADAIYAAQGRLPPDIAEHARNVLEKMYADARKEIAG